MFEILVVISIVTAILALTTSLFSAFYVYKSREKNLDDNKIYEAYTYSRSLIEASLDPLMTISAEGKITDTNDATTKATGLTRDQLIDSDFSSYFTEPEKAIQGYQRVLEQGSVSDYPLRMKHNSGSILDVRFNATVFRNHLGQVKGVFAAARDVTELVELHAKLERMALYDALTELPNRRLYMEHAKKILKRAKRQQERFCILFLDINNFKIYNDDYGHDIGDKILIETANKLQKIFRESDIISRWAGDEFVILCSNEEELNDQQFYIDKTTL